MNLPLSTAFIESHRFGVVFSFSFVSMHIFTFLFLLWSVGYLEVCCLASIKWSEVAWSCLTLCDPMGCSLPHSVHGIFQARVLEWVAISFSRGSSQPRDQTQVSCIVSRHFTVSATREVQSESCLVVYGSLWPHGLYSSWNSPGQNIGVSSQPFPSPE